MSEDIRQRLIKGANPLGKSQESEEDAVLNISLRPRRIPEFIGQKDIVDNLKICLAAAKQRKEPLEVVD